MVGGETHGGNQRLHMLQTITVYMKTKNVYKYDDFLGILSTFYNLPT